MCISKLGTCRKSCRHPVEQGTPLMGRGINTVGGVKFNSKVNVSKTDVTASNGLIHVIDAVLMLSA